ncbi:MAG: hypothetical protein ACXVB1_13715 [Pseudobdellovibrionaceae bacterium]
MRQIPFEFIKNYTIQGQIKDLVHKKEYLDVLKDRKCVDAAEKELKTQLAEVKNTFNTSSGYVINGNGTENTEYPSKIKSELVSVNRDIDDLNDFITVWLRNYIVDPAKKNK